MNQVWCASNQTLKRRTNPGCQKYNLNPPEFLRERFCRLQEIRFGKGECQKFKLHLRLNEEDILARGHFSLCKLTSLRVQRLVGITLGYRTWDCTKVRWPKIFVLNKKKKWNSLPEQTLIPRQRAFYEHFCLQEYTIRLYKSLVVNLWLVYRTPCWPRVLTVKWLHQQVRSLAAHLPLP